jgi:hypothetical protein
VQVQVQEQEQEQGGVLRAGGNTVGKVWGGSVQAVAEGKGSGTYTGLRRRKHWNSFPFHSMLHQETWGCWLLPRA